MNSLNRETSANEADGNKKQTLMQMPHQLHCFHCLFLDIQRNFPLLI